MERLSVLAQQLLSARDRDQVLARAERALMAVLGREAVAVERSPASRCGDRATVTVPGSSATWISVRADASSASMAFVESAAGLTGMALRRLEMEDELHRVEQARATLSGEVLEEASRERGRIATRIHDEVLPHLAAATIQADNVQAAADAGQTERTGELATKARHAVHDGIACLREVLDDLQHETVVPGRLREGLEELLDDLCRKEGIDARLDAPEALPAIPFAVELLVVETVRGCLGNVARHAQASEVVVSLAVYDCHVAVEVRDDGAGFDPETTPRGHGLALMAQRVEMARGRLAVRSAPGQGTTVTMEIPR